MTSYIAHPTIDSGNAYALSEWWKQVLDWQDDPDDPNLPEHPECLIQSADGDHKLLFQTVPEGKTVKNRIHFDLRPTDGTRDEEVVRLLGLGATEISDQRDHYGPGVGWVLMADPEGNEFCVCRSDAERSAE